jgi:hypothetical protein
MKIVRQPKTSGASSFSNWWMTCIQTDTFDYKGVTVKLIPAMRYMSG